MKLSIEAARKHWAAAQGLDGSNNESFDGTVARHGWIRTLGGAEAYLALLARNRSTSVNNVHALTEQLSLRVVPSVRGCIYMVPARDAWLSISLADQLSSKRNLRDQEKAGIKDGELDGVGEAVLEVLADGALTTHQVKKALPDGVVRSLGDAGKKVGLSSTLPPALRNLEFSGAIIRRLVDNRLDHEKYEWQLNTSAKDEDYSDPAKVHREMALKYFSWFGPATRQEFAAWTGLNQTEAKKAIAAAGLVEVEVDGLGECYMTEQAIERELTDSVAFLPCMDGMLASRESAYYLVDPEFHGKPVGQFGRPPLTTLGEVKVPMDRTILVNGEVVGLWAWDPDEETVVSNVFKGAHKPPAAIEKLLKELGHGKAFSLDKDEKLRKRVARVKAG